MQVRQTLRALGVHVATNRKVFLRRSKTAGFALSSGVGFMTAQGTVFVCSPAREKLIFQTVASAFEEELLPLQLVPIKCTLDLRRESHSNRGTAQTHRSCADQTKHTKNTSTSFATQFSRQMDVHTTDPRTDTAHTSTHKRTKLPTHTGR